jgi:tetratricopeptide (TPR) repeat protein
VNHKIAVLLLIVLGFSPIPANAQIHDPRALAADPTTAEEPIAPVLKGLGDNHFPVTTRKPESQQYFDQGLRLTYAFNHSEALRAFKEAVRLDPENAMAYWGWALVLGPNINLPMRAEVAAQAYRASQRASELKGKVSDREKAYINAIAQRYAAEPPADRAPLDQAYARAMKRVVERYPEDLDAATLYAAALMNLSPWNYFNLDGSPKVHTDEILETLQRVADRDPSHAGALHYFIHAVEERYPKRGEWHADKLRGLMPNAGHAEHMPSHIYMLVGRYQDSYDVNVRATGADETYITSCNAQGIYPLNYYPHNIHYLAWSAMFLGRPEAAMEAAREIVDKVPSELASDANLWALYEIFLSQPMFVMVRFGMWNEMLAEPKPEIDSQFMAGIWHYGRALAFRHTRRLPEARRELEKLEQLRIEMGKLERYVSATAGETLLTIAEEIVGGELAYAEGKTLEGLARLERAIRLEDSLSYGAPPDWYFPVRHYLGAMLLEAGRPNEAAVIYVADLRMNPENGYSLFGLKLALEQKGNQDHALEVAKRFDRAWDGATHKLTSSRY